MPSTVEVTFLTTPENNDELYGSYPDFAQSLESSEEIYDEILQDRTTAGKLKTRSLIPIDNIKRVFTVIHPAVSLADKTTIQDYYKVNRDTAFTFTWHADNTEYYVQFTSQPKYTILGGMFWRVETYLAEV